MRLQTRTWDQNGPKFIFDATYSGEGIYTCELYLNADSNCPTFIPVSLTKENYKKGKYFIKDELDQYILSEDEYLEKVQYYEKTEIEWEINALEKDGASIIFPKGKSFSGKFTIDNYSDILQQFEIQFNSNASQEDFLGFELRVNWNGYTYANITRYEEVQRGVLNVRLEGDSLFWTPELHYNNDYIRMTDELSIYWHYFYDENKLEEIVLTLSEMPRKDIVEENKKTLNEWIKNLNNETKEEVELITLILPKNQQSANISLGSLPKQPTPGMDLYATIYAQGPEGKSNKVRGIVAKVNQPPNQAKLSLTGLNNSVTEENEISFKISANNTFQEVIGEEEKIIIENSQLLDEDLQESIVYRFDEGWATTIPNFVSADFSTEKYPVVKVIVLAKPIQDIESFSNLEIVSRGIPKGVAPWPQTYTVGIVGVPEGANLNYDIINSPNFKKNSFTMSLSTWDSSNIDISSLDSNLNWHLCLTIDQYGFGYNLQSIKLTGGTESRTFNFLTNDQDNNQEDYKDLSHNLWYSINNGPKTKIEENIDSNLAVSLVLSKEKLLELSIQEPGTYSLEAYVFDGLEYSQPSSQLFSYYPELSFEKTEVYKEQISTGNENEKLTKNISFNFVLKNNITKLYEQVIIKGYNMDGQLKTSYLPRDFYTYDFSNQQKNIKINIALINLETLGLDPLRELGFEYKLSYQLDFQQYLEYQDKNLYYRPIARKEEEVFPSGAVSIFSPEATKHSQDKYFSDILTISTYYPELGIPYPAHESMTAYFYKVGSQDSFKQEKLDLVDDKWSKVISLQGAVQPGEEIRIELVYKDILGNVLVHSTGEENYIKASAPRFTNNSIESVPQVIKPFSTLSWRFNHALAQAQGTDDIGIVYNYELQLPIFLRTISEYALNEERVDYRRELILSEKQIQTLLLREEDKNLNENFLANLIITATDSFGKSTSISQEISIDYREAPSWSSNNFTLLHDYITARSEGDSYDISSLSQITTRDIDTQMFNAGEGIVFKIPKPIDINGYEDVTNFVIYLYRDNLTEKGPESFEGKISKQWLTISLKDENLVEKGDFYYYRYTASTYQKNEYFYFEIAAQDSTGLISEALTTKDLPIFGCRTAVPTFDQGVVNTSVEKIEQDWKIELKWRSFTINDLGGSATLDGWNLDYYNIYPNLERAVPNYNKDIYLKVEISPTPDFANRIEKILRDSDLSNYIDFKPYGSKGNNVIELILNQDKELKPAGLVNPEKFYLRFTLFIAYAPGAYIQSLPQIVSYFGSVPTVSHRSHHVGINNTEFESDDVFVIQNYQNRSKIRFIGVEADENGQAINHIIEIDLNKGLISGASLADVKIEKADFSNLIIDGGSW